MKNFQVIILVVFAGLALIGLVVFATSKGIGGGGDSVGTVSVWGLLPEDAVTATLTELAATDKRFAQVTYTEVDANAFGNELAQAIAEGSGPDLVIITQEQVVSEAAKLSAIPYSSYSERDYVDAFVPMANLFATEGGVYALPLVVDPLVLFYNRSVLTSAGIGAPPSTWEAVNGLAQALTQGVVGGTLTQSVIPLGGYANVENARAIISLLLFQAGIPISSVSGAGVTAALTSDDQSNSSAAAAAVDFYTQFSNPAKTVYTWNGTLPHSRDAFVAGDLVLYPGFASERAYLSAANPNLSFDVAAMPHPATSDERITYGLMYAAAIPRASMNPVGAFAVAKALSARSASAYLASASSMAPAHSVLLTPPANDRFAAVIYPEALRARGWLSPAPAVTDGIFAGMIGNVTSGRRSIEDAIQSAQASLGASLH